MEHNGTLNLSCDFKGYLVCKIPTNTVEVELKIKTTWGKYTFTKDTCTRTERYCPWDRVDKRAKIHMKKRKVVRREGDVETVSTNSETDIQDGEGFSYPPKVFTDPELANTISLTNSDDNDVNEIDITNSNVEVTNPNFIEEYCGECVKKYNRCYKSDWDVIY